MLFDNIDLVPHHLQIILVCKVIAACDAEVMSSDIVFLECLERVIIKPAIWTEVMRLHQVTLKLFSSLKILYLRTLGTDIVLVGFSKMRISGLDRNEHPAAPFAP
jgi:hypothetical protein